MQLQEAEVQTGYRADSDPALAEIVRCILTVEPQAKVVLFGSRARGTARPDSDYDLLVIVPWLDRNKSPSGHIHRAMRQVDACIDLLVMTPDQHLENFTMGGSVVYDIARDGKVLLG